MGYFDDIEFLAGKAVPACKARLKRRFMHTYSFEFLSGGRMHCAIDGGKRIVLDKPCAFWHHPKHVYDYGAFDDEGWDHHWVLMRGERARRILEECLMELFPAGYAPVSEPELFDEEFHALLEMMEKGGPSRHPGAVAMLERMAAQLVAWNSLAPVQSENAETLSALMESIRLNPVKPPDFKRTAAKLGMSYGNFRRLFKKASGHAPHEFVLLCRMRRAAETLHESRRRIKEIAGEMGYSDPAQFSKLFKAKIGIPPEEYRRALPR